MKFRSSFHKAKTGLQPVGLCDDVKEKVIMVFITGIIAMKTSPNSAFIIFCFIMTKFQTHELMI
jgi:hypothetical protein